MDLRTGLFVICLLTFGFAEAQSNHVLFSFEHRVAGQPMLLGSTVFNIWNGKKVRIDRAEMYLAEIALRRPDGSELELLDRYILVNGDGLAKETDLGAWPIDAAAGARMHIGLPDSVNHDDPAAWPAGHPLAPQNPSMHWGWAGGYRFVAVEGKVDADGDGVLESYFQWHNIFDTLYRKIDLAGDAATASDGKLKVHLRVDWAALFDGLEMLEDDLVQHGAEPLNIQMADNSAAGAFLKWPATVSASGFSSEKSGRIEAAPNPFSDRTRLDWAFEKAGDGLRLRVIDALGRTVGEAENLPAVGSMELGGAGFSTGILEALFFEKGRLAGRKRLLNF